MADRSKTPRKILNGIRDRAEFGTTTISVNDTVTFGGYDTTSTIWQVAFYRVSNGQAVTCTTALNVATVTQAGLLNEVCYYLAVGLKV
jgi:hypothetical protein